MAKKTNSYEAKRQISAAIGFALEKWGTVETALTHVFVSLLDPSLDPQPSGRTSLASEPVERRVALMLLNSVISFQARVDIVSAAVAEIDLHERARRRLKAITGVVLEDILKPDANLNLHRQIWMKLAVALKRRYKSRSEIAHFIFREFGEEVFAVPYDGPIISPSSKRLSKKDVDQKRVSFVEMEAALLWFRSEVELLKGRDRGPSLPDPPTIQEIRNQLNSLTP